MTTIPTIWDLDLLDEIAHRHGSTTNRVTDFYFAYDSDDGSRSERFKVVETASPTRIVGGETIELRFDYVVSVFTSGWTEVARMGQEHAESATHAALIALKVI